MKVLVIGATGMLGFAVHRYLHDAGVDVTGTARAGVEANDGTRRGLRYVGPVCVEMVESWKSIIDTLRPDVVINAAGVIKQREASKSLDGVVAVNAVFPRRLSTLAAASDFRLIHFSTDCVFSGTRGMYTEAELPDATDAYGISKFLGEVVAPGCLTIRTSIIGRGSGGNASLVDWFLGRSGRVRGFRRAIFSGLPVNEIARFIAEKVLPRGPSLSGLFHLSSAPIDKYSLLGLVRSQWARQDIILEPDDSVVIDRSLDSSKLRKRLHYEPPCWPELVRNMHDFYSSLAQGRTTQAQTTEV